MPNRNLKQHIFKMCLDHKQYFNCIFIIPVPTLVMMLFGTLQGTLEKKQSKQNKTKLVKLNIQLKVIVLQVICLFIYKNEITSFIQLKNKCFKMSPEMEV